MGHLYFKDITLQIKDTRKNKKIRHVDWPYYASLSMLHINPELGGGNTMVLRHIWGRVSAGPPKMPIGAAGDPNFCDFTNPNVPAKLRGIQRASLESDFRGKVNLSLNRRIQDMTRE